MSKTENEAAAAGETHANHAVVLVRAVADFNRMTIAAELTKKAALCFVDVWMESIQKVYLDEHQRLPWGLSSARLRKMRRKVLLLWLEKRFGMVPYRRIDLFAMRTR